MLELIDSGVIFRNPDPGHRYIGALFPHPLQLSEHELVCAYNRGSALYATDLVFYLARSTDGGVTWRGDEPIYDPAQDERPYSYHDPFLSRMADGSLVLAAFRADRSDPQQPMFSAGGGLLATEPVLFRSSDGGYSWHGPQPVALPEGVVATPANAVLELDDGRWFWPFDCWNPFDDPRPYRPRTLGLFSDDRGHTWSDGLYFADGSADGLGFWHGKPIRLSDGSLLGLYWAAEMETGRNLPIHRCAAEAGGRQWSTPTPTNLPGQTNALLELDGGRLVVVYTLREAEHPGIMAALSDDGGQHWDLYSQVCLWDATGRDRLGVEAPDTYPRSHDTIAFGAPAAIRTYDGDVYAAWWCVEAALVHVRWARLRDNRR